jgi:hypothetical protein
MTDDDADRLIQGYLDGSATEDEVAALSLRLEGDSAARLRYLRLACLNASLASGAVLDPAADCPELECLACLREPLTSAPDRGPVKRISRGFRAPAMGRFAAAVMAGMISVSLAWAYSEHSHRSPWAEAAVILSEGFEDDTAPGCSGMPETAGVWGGDDREVVPAERGVRPQNGRRMLAFRRSAYKGENPPLSAWCDVYRFVDMGLLRSEISDGTAVVRAGASFNAEPFPASEEFRCGVRVFALQDLSAPEVGPVPVGTWLVENSIAMGGRQLRTIDRRSGTWERVTAEVVLPPQTRYLLLHVFMVRHRPERSSTPVQFAGHYADDVTLQLAHARGQR